MAKNKRLDAWQKSVAVFTVAVTLTFVINLSFIIWAVLKGRVVASDGSFVLSNAEGSIDCHNLKRVNIVAHILINLLATIILSGTNYCMQCLSAPTRSEVMRAHRADLYLNIGVSSLHNLKHIATKRVWLWFTLGLSSWPLHLLYNSAIYTSTSANNYVVYSVGESFLQSDEIPATYVYNNVYFRPPVNDQDLHSYYDLSGWDPGKNEPHNWTEGFYDNSVFEWYLQHLLDLRQSFFDQSLTTLTAEDCVQVYTTTFQAQYRSLILVTDNVTDVPGFHEAEWQFDGVCGDTQPFRWTCAYYNETYSQGLSCDAPCDRTDIARRMQEDASAGNWTPFGDAVKYCLAESSQELCRLQFNLPIAITVVSLNLFKLVLMLCVAKFAFGSEELPLLSFGDAIKTFLKDPDETTLGYCLLSNTEIQKIIQNNARRPCDISLTGTLNSKYSSEQKRWGMACSIRRLGISLLLCFIALCVSGAYLNLGLTNLRGINDIASLWQLGIGATSGPGAGRAMVLSEPTLEMSTRKQLLKWVWLANLPQLVFSLLYFIYNGIFTAMLMADEWSSYAVTRKGLRIAATRPESDQRESYFLQLPYRWSVPLITCSTVVHWLISQSLFLVSVDITGFEGEFIGNTEQSIGEIRTLGYSPFAIILVIIIGTLLLFFCVLVASCRRFRSGMPVAASNSRAITAACHMGGSDGDRADAVKRRLQWGVIEEDNNSIAENELLASDKQEEPIIMEVADVSNQRSGLLSPGLNPAEAVTDIRYRHCTFSPHAVETPIEGAFYK